MKSYKRMDFSQYKCVQRAIKTKSTKKKNAQPERELQAKVMQALRLLGCHPIPVESKGIFIPSIGKHVPSKTPKGTSDILFVTKDGYFGAVECKAPGKKDNLTEYQEDFLRKIIEHCGFAMVCDDVADLVQTYKDWSQLPIGVMRWKFLLSKLGI